MRVDVWEIPLDEGRSPDGNDWALLTHDERGRAARYRYARHRNRFVQRRVALRRILAPRLGCGPEAIPFATGANGKPHVPDGEVHFNLSHSGNRALVGVATEPLGVDLEMIRTVPDADRIARRYFTEEETAAILARQGEDRDIAFLRCWTLKEAWLKAEGTGLSGGLHRISFEFDADPPTARLRSGNDEDWRFCRLPVAAGYAAAAARQGGDLAVKMRVWGE